MLSLLVVDVVTPAGPCGTVRDVNNGLIIDDPTAAKVQIEESNSAEESVVDCTAGGMAVDTVVSVVIAVAEICDLVTGDDDVNVVTEPTAVPNVVAL